MGYSCLDIWGFDFLNDSSVNRSSPYIVLCIQDMSLSACGGICPMSERLYMFVELQYNEGTVGTAFGVGLHQSAPAES